MAYNFLSLVNTACNRLNEVPLNTGNFGASVGIYSAIKEGINWAVANINQQAFEWPFNHVEGNLALVPGQVRYPYPLTVKSVDFDAFRVIRNQEFGNETKKLKLISYEEYLDKHIDAEYNSDNESIRALPHKIFRTPSQQFGVYPPPDKAYTLHYEYYELSPPLVLPTDTPKIPESFSHIILDGAMFHGHMFKSDTDAAQLSLQAHNTGIGHMRSIYINRYDYVRSTMKE